MQNIYIRTGPFDQPPGSLATGGDGSDPWAGYPDAPATPNPYGSWAPLAPAPPSSAAGDPWAAYPDAPPHAAYPNPSPSFASAPSAATQTAGTNDVWAAYPDAPEYARYLNPDPPEEVLRKAVASPQLITDYETLARICHAAFGNDPWGALYPDWLAAQPPGKQSFPHGLPPMGWLAAAPTSSSVSGRTHANRAFGGATAKRLFASGFRLAADAE